MADIFISYASADRDRIRSLVASFDAEGWSVWWDRAISAGESFDRVIEREVDAAKCIVVIWSNHSIESRWVRNEASEGLERDILAPVRIDDVKQPLAFRSSHAVDLIGWPNDTLDLPLATLISDIHHILGTDSKSLPESSTAKESASQNNKTTLAILPLTDLTPEQNMAYLCDGLAEDLMDALFPIDSIQVISMRDSFSFRNSQASIRDIGHALQANLVLEGSVRHANDRFVVSARLIEADGGTTVYSQRFVRTLDDPIELQSDIAKEVYVGLSEQLGVTRPVDPDFDPALRNPIAFALYQKSQHDHGKDNLDHGLLERIAMLECTIALDPKFERAYADLAIGYMRTESVITREGAVARGQSLLSQLRRFRPNSPAAWAIEVELETDMTALVQRCTERIRRGEGVHAYPHPTGWHDVRAGFARALAHSGLYREAFEYFALLDRPGEPNRYDNWAHQLGCLVALGEYATALDYAKRMKDRVKGSDDLFLEWEIIALTGLEDIHSAQLLLPELSRSQSSWGKTIIAHLQGGGPHRGVPISAADADTEQDAYSLLSTGQVDEGLTLLQSLIDSAEASGFKHWIAFRLPIYRSLFSEAVAAHPAYTDIVSALGLDIDSRARQQKHVIELSSMTGIEPASLINI